MIQTAALVSLSLLFAGIILMLVRVIRGPSMADRAMAADGLVMNLIGMVAVYSIFLGTNHFFDLVLVFSLLGFVGMVTFAKFLGRGRIVE